MTDKEYVKNVNIVSGVTLGVNAALSLVKLLTGILAGSFALVSDAAHSLSDCFSTIVVLVGVHIGARRSDKEHPFGHERMESIATLALAALLLLTAAFIVYNAIVSIVDIAGGAEGVKPSVLAFVIAILSIVVKGWMYFYTEKRAKKLNSSSLHGDALHHLSDSLSSVGAAIGILGAMCGVAVLDPIASLFIALMIVKASFDIARMATDRLVDKAADDFTERRIAEEIMSVEGVRRIDVLRTRMYGNKIFAEVEIAVDDDLSLLAAHRIAENVHEKVEHGIGGLSVKHCMVHVNPLGGEDNHEDPEKEMEDTH